MSKKILNARDVAKLSTQSIYTEILNRRNILEFMHMKRTTDVNESLKSQKAKHNLIYNIRRRDQGRVLTRQKLICYHFEKKVVVQTRRHSRLQREYGFNIQSEMF